MPWIINTVTVVTAGTAVQFGTATEPWKSVSISARGNNSSGVYVGTSTVNSTSGKRLEPGQEFVLNVPVIGVKLSDLYVDADLASDAIDYFVYSE